MSVHDKNKFTNHRIKHIELGWTSMPEFRLPKRPISDEPTYLQEFNPSTRIKVE
jgi:hypothetical protein